MLLPIVALVVGLILLVWSADKFVDGASETAKYIGISPLVIGMVIVGFGTSAPEMLVSALAAIGGNTGIALGNAYGSNIANIALILGVSAMISPIIVAPNLLKKELPILVAVTFLTIFLLWDGFLSRFDSIILLIVFVGIMGWTIYSGMKNKDDTNTEKDDNCEGDDCPSIKSSILWLIIGLLVLIASSRLLVWGATEIAAIFNVNDMIVGLTVVAIGTSLPELASSIAAARKGEDDIALGNVIGSNLFNTLAVVGIGGSIHPFTIPAETLTRDMPIMLALTLSLFILGYAGKGKKGCITRFKGVILFSVYMIYTIWLISLVINQQG